VGNTPARWYRRWLEWEHAQALRAAREAVEKHGMANVSDDARRLYNDLILSLRDDKPSHDRS